MPSAQKVLDRGLLCYDFITDATLIYMGKRLKRLID